MKFIALSTLMIAALTTINPASAAERRLTQAETTQVCRIIKELAPSERTLTQSYCREQFDFYILSEDQGVIEIEANGQTVEDMGTVCLVYLGRGNRIPESYCELQ